MAKIIVAFADPRKCEQIASVLDGCGLQVFRKCATGNEVMRAFDACHDGILVCGTRFPDRTADELAYDLGEQVLMLVLGKPDQLERCEHYALFRPSLRVSKKWSRISSGSMHRSPPPNW